MTQIPNWNTVFTRYLDDETVEEQIRENDSGVIAKFEHEPTGCEVEYRYEPDADKPYLVTCVTEGVEFEQEGRYATRTEGYRNGNRELRRQNPEIPELEPSQDRRKSQGLDEDNINASYPARMSEYPCPVCEKSFSDGDGLPGWRSLHSHMHAHTEEERQKAYAEWGAERLKEATIAMWRAQSRE